ncbi:MAG TPA: hypothetical protein PLD47_12660 [Aggregatilineales bacterium]|nr:hypothetical protein [Anaerolineales bacterium]HRE48569.1 hypothetical protein [Aggregatilineales bacterium]
MLSIPDAARRLSLLLEPRFHDLNSQEAIYNLIFSEDDPKPPFTFGGITRDTSINFVFLCSRYGKLKSGREAIEILGDLISESYGLDQKDAIKESVRILSVSTRVKSGKTYTESPPQALAFIARFKAGEILEAAHTITVDYIDPIPLDPNNFRTVVSGAKGIMRVFTETVIWGKDPLCTTHRQHKCNLPLPCGGGSLCWLGSAW